MSDDNDPAATPIRGAFILACTVAAAAAAAVPGRMIGPTWSWQQWTAAPEVWPLLLASAGAGIVMVTIRRWSRAAAVVALIAGVQLAGNGVLAAREAANRHNIVPVAHDTFATVVLLAALMAVAATASTMAAAAVVRPEPVRSWRGLLPSRPFYAVAGAAVVILLPLLFGATVATPIGTLVQLGLAYSLPWGAGVAAIGWLRGRPAGTAAVSVAVSVVLCTGMVLGPSLRAGADLPYVDVPFVDGTATED
ncbi:hypothetical protein [Actinoplanes sp. N902-109]|uniref:hypothetical protein n=1 Tax=Actinoplanes sp. (strain N902-109) TaxID=649831 RepID=UPI0003294D3D|nr:hypothetical protein [Actinoplanes sp. N902-109]AGL15903.1 hypothetical protein L083_2393 [Actinoplanes sp. N902-109]